MIPPILSQHYELIQELNTAQDLLDAMNTAGIKGAEVAGIFDLNEPATKACVYRALRSVRL